MQGWGGHKGGGKEGSLPLRGQQEGETLLLPCHTVGSLPQPPTTMLGTPTRELLFGARHFFSSPHNIAAAAKGELKAQVHLLSKKKKSTSKNKLSHTGLSLDQAKHCVHGVQRKTLGVNAALQHVNFTPCLGETKPAPRSPRQVPSSARLKHLAKWTTPCSQQLLKQHRLWWLLLHCRSDAWPPRVMPLGALPGISGLASLKAKRRSGWRTKQKGVAKRVGPGRVYLSLEPSFSISSCRGANSRLSIKLNS